MLMRGSIVKLRALIRRNGANFSTMTPPPSSPPMVYGGTATTEVAVDDLPLVHLPPASAAEALLKPALLQPRVLVYDGVCHLCHKGVKWVIEADKDKKIKFCCLQSRAAEPYMRICGVKREDVLRRVLFIEGPGLYHQGSAAALKVMSYLPFPYSALITLMIVPSPLRDAVYDYVAKQRYDWFGKGNDCLILKEKELLERFIDWEELLDRGARNSD